MIVATALVIAIVVSGIRFSPQKAKMSLVDNSLADLDADDFNEYLEEKGLEPEIDMTVDIVEARQVACDYFNEKYRIPNGLQPVKIDESLCKLADVRAKEICYVWGHDRADGTQIVDDVFDIGKGKRSIGENISTMNFDNKGNEELFGWYAESTLEDQLKMHIDGYTVSTSGHYENMMHPTNANYGIGVFYDEKHHTLFICDLYMN